MRKILGLVFLSLLSSTPAIGQNAFINQTACYLSGSVTACFKPVNVASGGTGAITLTSNGVLLGNGTSAVTAVTGTTSQVLIGGSGPSFGSVPTAALPVYVPATTAGIVPSAGLPGNTTGTAACAGCIGQVITNSTSSVSIATSDTAIVSVALTPGVWCVSGSLVISSSGSPLAVIMSISTTSGTVTGTSGVNLTIAALAPTSAVGSAIIPAYFVNVASNQSYFMVARITSGSAATGGSAGIQAVRIF